MRNRKAIWDAYNKSPNGKAAQQRYKLKNRLDIRKKTREAYYFSRYNLTEVQAIELRKRPCEICGKTSQRMVIDHKVLGSYRGILCDACNGKLGWYEKRSGEVLKYLEKS